MEFRVIIPARYDSKRLPGKVLLDIDGKPMLQHVYERAKDSGAESVVIATDDLRVAEVAEKFGATVCMTSSDHRSGTERIAEAVLALEYENDEIVVNVQADEPLIPPAAIREVAEDLAQHDHMKVSSLCAMIDDPELLSNPGVTKVVLTRRNFAMYFSRAAIPWAKNEITKKQLTEAKSHFLHIGLFAYRVGLLREYIEWSACPLEEMESLEQLRILWNGIRIHMLITKHKVPPGVNTKEDLEKVRAYIKQMS